MRARGELPTCRSDNRVDLEHEDLKEWILKSSHIKGPLLKQLV